MVAPATVGTVKAHKRNSRESSKVGICSRSVRPKSHKIETGTGTKEENTTITRNLNERGFA